MELERLKLGLSLAFLQGGSIHVNEHNNAKTAMCQAAHSHFPR